MYTPGNEPEEIRKYLNVLLKELHEKFPDDLVVMDMWNHERWDKLAGYLVQKLGYPNGRSFLNAYGFEVFDGPEAESPFQSQQEPEPVINKTPIETVQPQKRLRCPECGSTEISIETFQEDLGTTTVSKTKSKYKEAGHGCLWWLLIGGWWWIVDLFLWIAYFPFRLLFQIFKRKKYKGKATTVSQSMNEIIYKKMFTCQNCGHSWMREAGSGTIMSDISKAKDNVRNLKKNLR